jgi:transcriptional regulator with PAS, ATPase and Fis domain
VLKAIQNKQITRLGGTKTIHIDVRILAATNRELEQMVREKTFGKDLFYRLNVVSITLPPLRERTEDIIPLVTEFLLKFNSRYVYQKWVHEDVMNCLVGYNWPGNVRAYIPRLFVVYSGEFYDDPPAGQLLGLRS